jgi:hypothetical protein
MELGLDIMQIMSTEGRSWSISEVCGQLKESELFAYQVLRVLKMAGYVSGKPGAKGGYTLNPSVLEKTLNDYMQVFGRVHTESILTWDSASGIAGQTLTRCLQSVRLGDLFGAKVVSHPHFTPPGAA